jgi:hypothetical protein
MDVVGAHLYSFGNRLNRPVEHRAHFKGLKCLGSRRPGQIFPANDLHGAAQAFAFPNVIPPLLDSRLVASDFFQGALRDCQDTSESLARLQVLKYPRNLPRDGLYTKLGDTPKKAAARDKRVGLRRKNHAAGSRSVPVSLY